jgi:hypothetical protein
MVSRISRNELLTTAATSVQVAPARQNRVGIYITNVTGDAVTISKGETAAVLNNGIVLQPTTTWYEVDSGEGYRCWRGAIQVIGIGAGSVSISEDMEIKD